MKKKILIVVLFVIVKAGAQNPAFSTIDSLFENGRYQMALEKLNAIEKPSFLSNYKTAVIYESLDNYKQTARFLEQAIVFKDDKKASLKLAKVYQRLSKSNKSILIYENLLAKDSLNLILAYQLGKLYLKSNKHKNAISIFKDLIDKDSANANYSYQLGLSYAYVKDRDRMINSFIDTFVKDTTHVRAIAHLASSFSKLRDLDSMMLFVDKGLVLDKNHINLNKLKINNLYKNESYLETIPLLLNLDTIDVKETFSIATLGKVYYNLDSLETAKMYFKKLSRLDRKDFKANTYLGHIAMKEKDYRAAFINYSIATRKGKRSRDEEYYGLGVMYYEKKEPKLAIANFKKAYLENTQNYNALYELAKLSDDYYKDKKIGYKWYVIYLRKFRDRDKESSKFVERRIIEIKKAYFMKGESLE